jgi:hypothetical protein
MVRNTSPPLTCLGLPTVKNTCRAAHTKQPQQLSPQTLSNCRNFSKFLGIEVSPFSDTVWYVLTFPHSFFTTAEVTVWTVWFEAARYLLFHLEIGPDQRRFIARVLTFHLQVLLPSRHKRFPMGIPWCSTSSSVSSCVPSSSGHAGPAAATAAIWRLPRKDYQLRRS